MLSDNRESNLIGSENRVPALLDEKKLHWVDNKLMLLSKKQIEAVKTVFQKNTQIKLIRRTANRREGQVISYKNYELQLNLPYNVYRDGKNKLYAVCASDTLIGKGGHGRVKLGQSLENGQWIAVKIETIKPEKRERSLARLNREIFFESKLGWYKGHITFKKQDIEKYYIFKSYIFGQSLADLIKEKKFKNFLEEIDLGILILQTILEWHQQGCIHGDIKPKNIIVDSQASKVVLVDFGLSHESLVKNKLLAYVKHVTGTKYFMSPEFKKSLSKYERKYALTDKTESYAVGETLKRLFSLHIESPIHDEFKVLIAEVIALLQLSDPSRRMFVKEALEKLEEVKEKYIKSVGF